MIIPADDAAIRLSLEILAQGGVIGVPTETVYGLAGDASSTKAVEAIYRLKGRPASNPLIAHISGVEMANDIVEIDSLSFKLMERFWPGPLTLVLPLKANANIVPTAVSSLTTLALRHPQGIFARIIADFGRPLVAPSANRSGRISPTHPQAVAQELGEQLPLILDGGTCTIGLESTILKIEGETITMLRAGGLAREEIEDFIHQLVQFPASHAPLMAPGMMESHYAPQAKVRLNVSQVMEGENLLAFGGKRAIHYQQAHRMLNLSEQGNLIEAATHLFAYLRQLDEGGVIAVEPIPEEGLGAAINDRLRRAAAPRPNFTQKITLEQEARVIEDLHQGRNNASSFIVTAILKRDIFSETRLGYFEHAPDVRVVRRVVSAAPWWSRPLAWILARREIRSLRTADDIAGVPKLIHVDADGLYRSWQEGTPLHLARPNEALFYREAHKILRQLRRHGLTHNDLAKPQNWLMTPEGKPALIDFQLTSVHSRHGLLFRYFAYEDFRHLIKQKRSFAQGLMTPTAWRIVRRRSWPSRLWLQTGKKIYNFCTRTLFNWSDGEGTGDRVQAQEPAIRALLMAHPNIHDFALTSYSRAAKVAGLYLFVETNALDEETIRLLLKGQKIELVQPVRNLPRRENGQIRDDILRLIAINELGELELLCQTEPQLAPLVKDIIKERRNFTDRRLYQFERDLSS